MQSEEPKKEITPEEKKMQETMLAFYALLMNCDDKMSKKQIWKRYYAIQPVELRGDLKKLVLSMPRTKLLSETFNEYSVRRNIERALKDAMIP